MELTFINKEITEARMFRNRAILRKLSIDDVAKALESGQRKLAGITAPAHGLYFLSVIYPHGVIKWPLEVIDN